MRPWRSRHPVLDDAAFGDLHELRLRGRLSAATPGAWEKLERRGWARRDGSTIGLTTAGSEAHAEWARLPSSSPGHAAARHAYDRFLSLNDDLLRVCSEWQVTPAGARNDHSDPMYDDAILTRLGGVHDRITAILRRLGADVPRFTHYRESLRTALERARTEDSRWVASPTCDSYHTVWMRLHEDLLLALGRSRDDEA